MIAAFLPAAMCASPGRAAPPGGWSMRERIPGSHDRAEPPILVADCTGAVHAFHSQPLGKDPVPVGIVYSRWTREEGWSEKTDVLLPPFRGQAHAQGASIDHRGMLHLVFFGGDDHAAHLYYARVAAVSAARATAWSRPRIIGDFATTPRAVALWQGEDDDLQVLYGGNRGGRGLFDVHSADAGETWSVPAPVFLTGRDDLRPWALRLVGGEDGRRRAVWAVVGRPGTGEQIWYAATDADVHHWLDPVPIAAVKQDQYEVDWPSLAVRHGNLLMIYNDFHPPKRQMIRSNDGGQTWSEPEEPFAPTRGEYGAADFAVDSAGNLHVLFGDRGRGLNLWHSVWTDAGWAAPDAVAAADEAPRHRQGADTFHPQRPRAVITRGNVLLVVWRSDPGVARNGTWYSYRHVDAKEIPAAPLPIPPPVEPGAAATPVPPRSPTPLLPNVSTAETETSMWAHPAMPVALAFFAAAAFVAAVLIGRGLRRRR